MKPLLKNKIIAVITTACLLLGKYKYMNRNYLAGLVGDKNSLKIEESHVAAMPEKQTTGELVYNQSRRRAKEEDEYSL